MGHYCRICERVRPNERFSGKGHKIHICKECSRKPKKEIGIIEQEDEIFGFLNQSYISQKNISRLKILSVSNNKKISELASIVLEVSQIIPYKKRRLKILAQKRKELLQRLEETGLIFTHNFD